MSDTKELESELLMSLTGDCDGLVCLFCSVCLICLVCLVDGLVAESCSFGGLFLCGRSLHGV